MYELCANTINVVRVIPGGLVVRIRRSHRRGPGSIPGQGNLSQQTAGRWNPWHYDIII